MRQLVIVVSDLYFAAGAALPGDGETSPPSLGRSPGLIRLRGLTRRPTRARLPGFSGLMRFGTLEELPQGWRSWLAAWLGREDLASSSPGSIAACTPAMAGKLSGAGALPPVGELSRDAGPSRVGELSRDAGLSRGGGLSWVWLADPLHLVASLTSVHLSPEGRLRLDEPAQAALCRAFDATFGESGYSLAPSRWGRFLARGPAPPGAVETTDPARFLGSTIADALPRGRGASALRRLGGEIEMWLHEHPINALRARSGQPPVSTLWLWGGGAPLAAEERAPTAGDRSPATAIFGDDPYVEGLSHLVGAAYAPAARSVASAAAAAERAAIQIELFNPTDLSRTAERRDSPADELRPGSAGDPWAPHGSAGTPLRAIEAVDRHWIEPALELLARREIERLVVVANDRKVSMTRRDRLKRWRRRRSALAALAAPHGVAESHPGRTRP